MSPLSRHTEFDTDQKLLVSRLNYPCRPRHASSPLVNAREPDSKNGVETFCPPALLRDFRAFAPREKIGLGGSLFRI
jgi:hypothetical protein